MASLQNPLAIVASPSCGTITRGNASKQGFKPISLGGCRCHSTLSSVKIKPFGSFFFLDANCREVRQRATSFQVFKIRNASSRRHHRKREEDFPAHLRPKKDDPRMPAGVPQFTNSNKRDDKVVITLDVEQLKHRAADAVGDVQRVAGRSVVIVQRAAKQSVDQVVRLANAAAQEGEGVWKDLRSSVRVQRDKHVVISIRRSTLEFAGKAVVGSILFVVFVKLLLHAMNKYRWGWDDGFGRSKRVVRDRSLAGKEVTLNRGASVSEGGPVTRNVKAGRAIRGPLDMPLEDSRSEKDLLKSARARGDGAPTTKAATHLPGWWPDPDLPPTSSPVTRQRDEQEAHSLVQGMMQKRLAGFDFSAADILQLRQLCKTSGTKVKFDTYNTRDSFYRASINLVLSACQGAGKFAMAEYGSEGGIRFIAGLASNIGLESGRAAIMVNAAVAARTRAALLQARALRMQSKFTESEDELMRLIRLLSYFRPDHNSAEMEMVARGLGSHFDMHTRKEMLHSYEMLGGADTKRVAGEALGLFLNS